MNLGKTSRQPVSVLITGANGFIGGYLVDKLATQNRFSLYMLSREPFFTTHQSCNPLTADITEKNWVDVIPTSVDIVIHLAQSKQYRTFPDGAEDMVRVNINSTLDLLEWSRRNKVQQFVFASTGNVYKQKRDLMKETDICWPESMYAATKMSAEFLVQQYGQFFRTTIVRLFSVYGPWQKDMIIPTMIKRIKTGEEITLPGGSGPHLTPIYVSDCVNIVEKLFFQSSGRNEIFNIAGNETVHLRNIVDLISRFVKRDPILRITEDTPDYLQGSSEKICDMVNYQPEIDLAEGIKRTVEAYINGPDIQ